MITEDYVSFETATLLKEKGFDGDTNCYYIEESVDKNLCYSPIRQNHNKRITNNEFDIDINVSSGKISAPTLQMAMKWLREEHNVHINLDIHWLYFANSKGWMYVIKRILENGVEYIDSKGDEDDKTFYSTYEEAAEAAIKYYLENLI